MNLRLLRVSRILKRNRGDARAASACLDDRAGGAFTVALPSFRQLKYRSHLLLIPRGIRVGVARAAQGNQTSFHPRPEGSKGMASGRARPALLIFVGEEG